MRPNNSWNCSCVNWTAILARLPSMNSSQRIVAHRRRFRGGRLGTLCNFHFTSVRAWLWLHVQDNRTRDHQPLANNRTGEAWGLQVLSLKLTRRRLTSNWIFNRLHWLLTVRGGLVNSTKEGHQTAAARRVAKQMMLCASGTVGRTWQSQAILLNYVLLCG